MKVFYLYITNETIYYRSSLDSSIYICIENDDKMEIGEIVGYLISAAGGGSLASVYNWRANKKKAATEAKMSEIESIHQTVEQVYKPIIEQQNTRIRELEGEVKELRETLAFERIEHQKQLNNLQKQIVDITRALGIRANNQVRDKNGRYIKTPLQHDKERNPRPDKAVL